MIRIINIKLGLDQVNNKEEEILNIKKYIYSKYVIKKINDLKIFKKSVDARNKDEILFVYTVDMEVTDEKSIMKRKNKDISISPNLEYVWPSKGSIPIPYRPVIVGFGPSGIFSALILAKSGYRPLIIEMGSDVDNRDKAYEEFISTRVFKKNASIQFGEGGAGTYSDGKLTTSISDLRCRFVLETLVKHGANEEIIYNNKPHVGTDVLRKVVKSVREEIISLGGTILFDTELTDIIFKNNALTGIEINHNEVIDTSLLLLGIGHSSRATYELLYEKGFDIERKPFSIGLRIEHPQTLIDNSQYGESAGHPNLRPAEYKLVYHDQSDRSVYTFCMCPGGYVMCGTSEEGTIVTNGMSESKRDGANANSAVLVNVKVDDFESNHVLAGMYFQRDLEKRSFQVAGDNYNAPSQLVGDFINNRVSKDLERVTPTYQPGVTLVNFNEILPNFITAALKKGLIDFDRKLKGFAMDEAVLTGPETRSSSPIRIIRNSDYETSFEGVYSMGEGAGYAGGIMSSAVDGIKVAESIIKKYSSF